MDVSPQAHGLMDTMIAVRSHLVDMIGKFMRQIVSMAEETEQY